MVTGEQTTLEEMGGALVHCTESGVGHFLCRDEDESAHGGASSYLSYVPDKLDTTATEGRSKRRPSSIDPRHPGPRARTQPYDARQFIRGLVDADSFFEIQEGWAREVTVGFARLAGESIGVVANNSRYKGGVLFVDSADKAARFIQLCDAFNVPLLFLADVPGFMVGSAVERQGIIRHGAKLISAVSEATVPKICVVVRKAYGAGLYAMAGG